ncbi:hypothetical protein B6D60_05485 [candidate division KSB1 bacterium 4484_87]|nr:MAG: hypothetical protein B6D60_05485 [candidate division KSB1 bacterium 4484_87]
MVNKLKSSGTPIVISGELYKSISEIVNDLAAKIHARTVVFSDMNGHPITQRGVGTEIDLPSLSALGAGSFSATAQIAKIVGEKDHFRFIFHEGEKFNLFLSNVGNNFLLITVFDTSSALGMVRIYTKRAIQALEELLQESDSEESNESQFLDVEFSKILNQELEKAFKL